jgi:hypothetical protein
VQKPKCPDSYMTNQTRRQFMGLTLERATCLDQACEVNPALRQQIESLLSAYAHAGDSLNQTRSVRASEFLIERTGTMIGNNCRTNALRDLLALQLYRECCR